VGYLDAPLVTLAEHPELVERSSRLTAAQLEERTEAREDLQLVDVRDPGEVRLGTIRGARNLPLASLANTAAELDPARPTVVFCAGGYRSTIGASLLRARGFNDVSDVLGGFEAWRAAGLPVDAA
jgi:rhodanese-related sulfurtransferase